MYCETIEYLRSVPDVIWSGVIASCITLAGVMLSNWSNTKRLEKQLSHDAKERANDKISNIRKEVYLKAVEDIATTNIHVATIADRDLTKSDMSIEFQTIAATMEKLKIVAEPKTAILAAELNVQFGALVLKLLPKLVPLHEARSDIEINNTAYDKALADASRVMQEIHKFNEDGRQDVAILQALQKSHDFFRHQFEQYAEARSQAYEKCDVRLRAFNEELLPQMKELSKTQLKLIVSIRNDLGVTTDVGELQRQLERHWAVIEAGYSDAMNDLQVR
jgi:hypothetical protein